MAWARRRSFARQREIVVAGRGAPGPRRNTSMRSSHWTASAFQSRRLAFVLLSWCAPARERVDQIHRRVLLA